MKTIITTLSVAVALALGVAGCKKAEQEKGPDEPAKTRKAKPEHPRGAHAGHMGHMGRMGHTARKTPEARMDAPVLFDAPPKIGTRAKCPVMGNVFTVSKDSRRSSYKGKHVAFCCPECKPKFDKNPEKYLSKHLKKG